MSSKNLFFPVAVMGALCEVTSIKNAFAAGASPVVFPDGPSLTLKSLKADGHFLLNAGGMVVMFSSAMDRDAAVAIMLHVFGTRTGRMTYFPRSGGVDAQVGLSVYPSTLTPALEAVRARCSQASMYQGSTPIKAEMSAGRLVMKLSPNACIANSRIDTKGVQLDLRTMIVQTSLPRSAFFMIVDKSTRAELNRARPLFLSQIMEYAKSYPYGTVVHAKDGVDVKVISNCADAAEFVNKCLNAYDDIQ